MFARVGGFGVTDERVKVLQGARGGGESDELRASCSQLRAHSGLVLCFISIILGLLGEVYEQAGHWRDKFLRCFMCMDANFDVDFGAKCFLRIVLCG